MIAFVNGGSRPLQGHILGPAEYIQGAYRRVAIPSAEKKRADRFKYRGAVDGLGFIPSGADKRIIDIIQIADNHQIEWIAQFGALFIGGAARQPSP